MKVIVLMVMVEIVGGAHPEVKILPGTFMEMNKCEMLAAKLNPLPPSEEYDERGRPILQLYRECLAIDQPGLLEMLKDAEG